MINRRCVGVHCVTSARLWVSRVGQIVRGHEGERVNLVDVRVLSTRQELSPLPDTLIWWTRSPSR